MFAAGAALALAAAALGVMTMTGVAYLVYLVAADLAMVVIIMASPHRRDVPARRLSRCPSPPRCPL